MRFVDVESAGLLPPDPSRDHFERPVNTAREQALLRWVHGSHLDVGCGSGAYVEPRPRSVGLDLSASTRWGASRYVIGSGLALPFADRSFDAVTAFEVLEHLEDPEAALLEWRRVAREHVLISVPNCEVAPAMSRSGLAQYHWVDRTHVQFFTEDSLVRFIRSCGLVPREVQLVNRHPVGPYLASLLGLSNGRSARVVSAFLDRLPLRRPWMTLLAICEV